MSVVGRTMWEHIRSGEVPTKDRITAVAGAEAAVLGERSAGELGQRWTAEVLGGGPLQPLLDEPDVTDVLVNGPGQVWIDRGDGLQPVDLNLGDEDAVRRLAVRLAAIAGRRLDDASPWVDGQLPGGVRLHAMLPPLVSDGPHLSLRIPRRTGIGLSQLCARGLTDVLGERLLTALVEQKVAFVVTGGTGSGKTTLLSSMLALVPAAERLLVVEDVREMIVEHPHVVRLESRPPNVEGAGEVTLAALVRQALRMRPDRVVVGEVRGAEVRELMSALNTGHEGGCGTLHANSPVDVISRFEALGALGGMAPSAVRSQLASSVRVVVHVQRTPAGRRLAQVGVIGVDEGELRVRPALRWEAGQAVPMEGLSALESVLGRAVR
ncbi:pilus assembly protein CpaF [Yimella lutea]|uniref:Pilus assembly protein CpaF n=1 Tax=Yimella lutea TaxID=587872 RepID=A0A542EDI7_9MICO|nr:MULTISPECIES: TadA family conjugal transfer-associated ATPase [Yimella]TQJ13360.1 pilus assembly protein CpaF [Yimella lutea]